MKIVAISIPFMKYRLVTVGRIESGDLLETRFHVNPPWTEKSNILGVNPSISCEQNESK